jgi:hypothetical protein
MTEKAFFDCEIRELEKGGDEPLPYAMGKTGGSCADE